ncbi:PREDICTED: uncharacterized protein LOC109468281 [Branchiostoma belcheri]|uniref:Uncharacterized protein LOC109468281 n=1 Tax=Branchiostoma belcheri TaxID=7741 RepID=A0A6P4XZN5_BRABE|nr:PREDICTED: uncharacterized protein LOC109468281 [Branchiostoma belcheri]
MIIPVKNQPPTDARLQQFCVEIDVGCACLYDLYFGNDEENLAPKYALRSSRRIIDTQSILYRIFVPTDNDSKVDNVDFVPWLWYKDNNGCDVTILSSLWFNSQVGVDNIIMAPLGQEGVVFVDMAYTVTKRGLKLTVVMEMEVNKQKAIKDIANNFLKIPMDFQGDPLDQLDNQLENNGLEEPNTSDSPLETSAVLLQKCTQAMADVEKCTDDNYQIVTQHLDELTNSFGDGAVDQQCQTMANSQESPFDQNVGDEQVLADELTTKKSQPESPGEVQYIMRVLKDQQQMRDENERETAQQKQRLQLLIHEVEKLTMDQQNILDTIAKEEQDPDIPDETKGEAREERVDRLDTYTPPIQDTDAHNYKDQQMLEFQNHLQRRAAKNTVPQAMATCCGTHQGDSGVWKGKPPSPAKRETSCVTTLVHYKKAGSTWSTIHLGHCRICTETIAVLQHGAVCQEDGCATCLQIASEVAQHIAGCTRGTQCPLPICVRGVPLGLDDDAGAGETPVFVGLVRLYLRRTFPLC